MGTRGLLFIRWKGRYYIYYNHWDSYPEGLGKAIVEKIPATPKEYQEWLQNMRQTYTRLSAQFEEHILPISADFLGPDGMTSRKDRYFHSYLALDDRLAERPTAALGSYGDIFIEWIYTIDLDRELLVVDQSVCLQLARLPDYPNWAKYLKIDRRERRILAANTPSDLVGDAANNIRVDGDLRARYNFFDLEIRMPEILGHSKPNHSPRVTILIATLLSIFRKYRDMLDVSYLEWSSTSFPFREIAFAIMSIAAGEVAYECPQSLDVRYLGEGFLRIPDPERPSDGHRLLPIFLSECHAPDVRPGSAPESSPFWVGKLLVYLEQRLNLVEVEEAAIAAIVDFGLGQGSKSFRAVVFSILDFILIDVKEAKDGRVQICRTPLINLIYFDDTTSRFAKGPRSRGSAPSSQENTSQHEDEGFESDEESDEDTEEKIDDDNDEKDVNAQSNENTNDADDSDGGFVASQIGNVGSHNAAAMLIEFFDSAMDEYLEGTKSRVLPNEILTTIMEHADHQTYLSLARASACWRDLYYRRFRLNNDYTVVGPEDEALPNSITLEDLESGERTLTSLGSEQSSEPYIEMSPVIGVAGSSRMSILNKCHIRLMNVSHKRPPYPQKKDMPIQEQYSSYAYPPRTGPERLFQMPDYHYLGSLEDGFGCYIRGILQEQMTIEGAERPLLEKMTIEVAQYPCLFPHGYRLLKMHQHECSGLQIFLRPANHESPEEWIKTKDFAVKRLHLRESEDFSRIDRRGCPVIIAFGRRLRLFYYVNQRDRPSEVDTPLPHCVAMAERCKEEDSSRRFVELIPGDEPVNLDDSTSRKEFETLLQGFCSPAGEWRYAKYNPFTAKISDLCEKISVD